MLKERPEEAKSCHKEGKQSPRVADAGHFGYMYDQGSPPEQQAVTPVRGSSWREPFTVGSCASSSAYTASTKGASPTISAFDKTSSTHVSSGSRFRYSDINIDTTFPVDNDEAMWEIINQVDLGTSAVLPQNRAPMGEDLILHDNSFYYSPLATSPWDAHGNKISPVHHHHYRTSEGHTNKTSPKVMSAGSADRKSDSSGNISGGSSQGRTSALRHAILSPFETSSTRPADYNHLSPVLDVWSSGASVAVSFAQKIARSKGKRMADAPLRAGGIVKKSTKDHKGGAEASKLGPAIKPGEIGKFFDASASTKKSASAGLPSKAKAAAGRPLTKTANIPGVKIPIKKADRSGPKVKGSLGAVPLGDRAACGGKPPAKDPQAFAKLPAAKVLSPPLPSHGALPTGARGGKGAAATKGPPAGAPVAPGGAAKAKAAKHAASSDPTLAVGSDKWFQKEEETLRSKFREIGILLTLRFDISAVNQKVDVIFRNGMTKAAATFSRTKLLKTTLKPGSRELLHHTINVIETRSNGQGSDQPESTIFGKPMTCHVMVLKKKGQSIGAKGVGAKVVFRFYKELATEGEDQAAQPRMEYLVQMTGGGGFANDDDVVDLIADIFSTYGVVQADVVIRKNSSTFSVTNKDTFGKGSRVDIPVLLEEIKKQFEDVKLIKVTGGVSFFMVDPKCKPQLQKTGTIYMPFCREPRRVRLECLRFMLINHMIIATKPCDDDDEEDDSIYLETIVQTAAACASARSSRREVRASKSSASEAKGGEEAAELSTSSDVDLYGPARSKRSAPGPDAFVPLENPEKGFYKGPKKNRAVNRDDSGV